MVKDRKTYRQVALNRKRMQEALIDLLSTKIFAKITVSAIAERAELSRRTFYEHFDSKDELVLSIVDDVIQPFFDELAVNIIKNPLFSNDSEEAFITLFTHWKENYPTISLLRKTNCDLYILRLLKECYYKMYINAVVPKQILPGTNLGEMIVDFLAGSTFMVLLNWSENGMDQTPALMGEFLFSLIGPPSIKETSDKFTPLFN